MPKASIISAVHTSVAASSCAASAIAQASSASGRPSCAVYPSHWAIKSAGFGANCPRCASRTCAFNAARTVSIGQSFKDSKYAALASAGSALPYSAYAASSNTANTSKSFSDIDHLSFRAKQHRFCAGVFSLQRHLPVQARRPRARAVFQRKQPRPARQNALLDHGARLKSPLAQLRQFAQRQLRRFFGKPRFVGLAIAHPIPPSIFRQPVGALQLTKRGATRARAL